MMELADTSSLRIIAFQLSGSRCEHTMVLFLCSFRFSRSSKRILISLSSVIVWSRKSSRMISSHLRYFFILRAYTGIFIVILLFKSYHAFQKFLAVKVTDVISVADLYADSFCKVRFSGI